MQTSRDWIQTFTKLCWNFYFQIKKSFLPVLPHVGLSKNSVLPFRLIATLLLLPALLFACTFRGNQHLFSVHVHLHWSFCLLFFLWVFSPLSPCFIYFHAAKLPCFWAYANKNINPALSLRWLWLWSSTYSSDSKPQWPRKQKSYVTFSMWS